MAKDGDTSLPPVEATRPGADINTPTGTAGLVVVCKTDRRSARAAAELVAAGLRDVAVLRGGTDGWHSHGLALE